ncbi:MAG: ATP-binding protein [Anaerotignum sp.]|nr:ATP-binding protein [Anaerotignum sp.]
MAKVVLVCGKICSGKSYYASKLKEDMNAVVFSCDELIKDIFPYDLNGQHDEVVSRTKLYLHRKASEVAKAGTNVILEFGFWNSREREEVSNFYAGLNIPFEWHYVDISDDDWATNVRERNRRITEKSSKDYYLDDGLIRKMNSLFEKPSKQEMTVWYINRRL